MLLDAAAAVVRDRGTTATLDEIASQAGVSKGAVLYHYASKRELLLAVVDDHLETFRAAVMSHLDGAPDEPGRLTRAYIRSHLDPATFSDEARDDMLLVAKLTDDPEVAERARADALRWKQELQADGLPQDVSDLVIAAADGAQISTFWGSTVDEHRLDRLRERLLAMTRDLDGGAGGPD
jgi:AcrR family transcriptional regulator